MTPPVVPQAVAIAQARPKKTRLNDENLKRLVESAYEINTVADAATADAIGYLARILIQTNLPHRDPGDVVAWNRRNGDFLLQITPGVSKPDTSNVSRRLGIPYGTYPRLILSWVTTEALRTKNPELFLGRNLTEFMGRLDLAITGGNKGTITRLREQMMRLFTSTISWSFMKGHAALDAGIRPFEGLFTFWDPHGPDQESLFTSRLLLNQRLFQEILRASVPLDMRVVRELARQRSSLGIDLYGWLTHKQHFLQQTGKPVFVSWKALCQQLGGDYARESRLQTRLPAHSPRREPALPGLQRAPGAARAPRPPWPTPRHGSRSPGSSRCSVQLASRTGTVSREDPRRPCRPETGRAASRHVRSVVQLGRTGCDQAEPASPAQCAARSPWPSQRRSLWPNQLRSAWPNHGRSLSPVHHRATPARMRKLREHLGVSLRTVERWRAWWREAFAESPFWRVAATALMPPVAAGLLPASLERFAGDEGIGTWKIKQERHAGQSLQGGTCRLTRARRTTGLRDVFRKTPHALLWLFDQFDHRQTQVPLE